MKIRTSRSSGCLLVVAFLLVACGASADDGGGDGAAPAEEEDEGEEEPVDHVAGLIDEYGLHDLDCEEVEPHGSAVAGVWCLYGETGYELHRFEMQADLRGDFAEVASAVGEDPLPWRQDTDEGPRGGSAIAYLDPATASTIVWTQETGLVMGFAWREGDDDLAALVEWWGSDGSVIEGFEAVEPSPLASIRAGDCIRSIDDSIEAVACGDEAAEAEVLSASDDTERDCGSESDRSYSESSTTAAGWTESYHFCLATIVDPATDQALEAGSCLELTQTSDANYDVHELRCDDPDARHEVLASVTREGSCPSGTEARLNKSDVEIERSGEGDWCVGER